ncbi:phosphotransacetylase family protein [Halosimplex halobium]|uniref:phosphotransacetylase family protein n=1 Tax=Halosimplex halobium TaxID=3396618 RepID=UPI003F5544B3
MKPIFVTSTGEGTGKTAIAVAVAKLAQDRGLDVAYFKPKGTRLKSPVGKTRDEDPLLAKEMLGIDADLADLEPVVYSPAFIEEAIRGNRDGEVRERVREHFDALADEYDLVVVEGGGRLETGGIVGLTDPDVAELLDARTVVVGGYANPADVDGVLAAARQFEGHLAGVLFNAVADANFDSLNTDVVPFLETRDIPVLGIVPRVQELAGVTVADLADALGAELLNPEASTDGFVERFAVGAMGSDAALRHFRRMRNAAMVTGGDRSEIQAAALQAPGIECIVLTGGLRPSGAILGKAAEADVPVLLVQSDTRVTVDRVEEVISTGRTRDPETVERMVDLLSDHADLEGLLAEYDAAAGTSGAGDPEADAGDDTEPDGE